MIALDPTLRHATRILRASKTIWNDETGGRYRALSADAPSIHGISPAFSIHDELGEIAAPTSDLYSAVEDSMRTAARPLSLIISTVASDPGRLFNLLVTDAQSGRDSAVVCHLYQVPADYSGSLYGEEALKLANPGWAFMNQRELLAAAAQAEALPSFRNAYRRFSLNQAIASGSPFMSRDLWAGCAAMPRPIVGRTCFAGADLSATHDLTALAFISSDEMTDLIDVEAHFWLPEAALDGPDCDANYLQWTQQGFIRLCPGKRISPEMVAADMRELFRERDVRRCGYDSWGMDRLKPWLAQVGFPASDIDGKFIAVGQNYKGLTNAVSDLEGARLRHGANPVLRMCMANVVTTMDTSGNRKFDRKKSRRRIDGAVALLFALAVMPEGYTAPWDPAAFDQRGPHRRRQSDQ
jgi:phage terminase large subunit-like protein